MMWKPILILSMFAFSSVASGQGYSPKEAVARMTLPPGFTVRAVATEPMIRQPLSMSFDERGRLWVLQYLQYPNPAGLKALKQDQYLRTIWDRVPEPPPKGPKGVDRITILSDPDAHGVYRKSHDFLTGLNMATGFCIGRGGVYVVQPPYLLFYPDKNGDDLPDTDTPDVLATGFGMEDTHSYANSLQWGPDGWLYGAHGSTVTAKIVNPGGTPNPIEFQQGIWRYHPISKRFELFAEGGGNTYGLDFDKHGNAIAGTNDGRSACLHQVQGAYYVKGFTKHGPLHNPHTYGYFEHIPHANFKGGHVTCGGVVYQGDTYPSEMHDQYIAGNLLSNAVYWHKFTADGGTFKNSHGGDLMMANDTWHRPVDLLLGPDGSIYVADWYDKRAAHLDPIDSWDKTNGRIYKIEYAGTANFPKFDLRKKTSLELLELLKHANASWRREARRLLTDRADATTYPTLKKTIATETSLLALESMWALHTSGGADTMYLISLLAHPNEHVRAWAVRLVGDAMTIDGATAEAWIQLAMRETSAVVRVQMACSAKRASASVAVKVVAALIRAKGVQPDPRMPLLMWWAVESQLANDPVPATNLALDFIRTTSAYDGNLVKNIARRLMANDIPDGQKRLAGLLHEAEKNTRVDLVLSGISASLDGGRNDRVAPELLAELKRIPTSVATRTILTRLGDNASITAIRNIAADNAKPIPERIAAIELLRQVRDTEAKAAFVEMLQTSTSDPLRIAILPALEAFDDPKVGQAIVQGYAKWSPALKKRAIQSLLARKSWALLLLGQVEAKVIPATDLTTEQVRTAMSFDDPAIAKLAEKHYGKIGPATPGEKQARISWLGVAISRGKGDAVAGKILFKQQCASCHVLHGEGIKIGPELTAADRKNVGYMLANIVDPNALVRPEFVQHIATTLDGRKLSGLVIEANAESMTLLDAQNRKIVLAKADIEEIKPTAVSLMPEKLLDTLSDAQVCDLFAYLRSDPPPVK